MLCSRAGAVGINLTQANRVFLMEPCLNPALEAQAIGRVHRLGQKREVEVTRLIMEDSVESRLLELLKKKYGPRKEIPENSSESIQLVGNVCTDRAAILTEEFDLLFGFESASISEDDNHADAVISSANV